MKTIEDTYAADLKEISSTVTGTMLAEMRKFPLATDMFSGADLKLARSLANMSKTERRAAADTMKAGWDREADQDIYGGRYGYIQKEQKAIDLAGGNFFLDLAERQAAGEKINFSDPKLLSQYYGRMYKSGQGEIAKEAKANQALERAKTAASAAPSSAASAMTAEAAQEEQKKNIVNPWL